MIIDNNLRVSTDQAVTASAVSTDCIDLSQARDIGEGKPLYAVFTVTTTFATLTSLTLNVVADTAAGLGSATVLTSSAAITLASGGLAAGKQYVLVVPPALASTGKRYLGASYTVGGSNATAGKVTCDFVECIQDGMKFHASGFSVT